MSRIVYAFPAALILLWFMPAINLFAQETPSLESDAESVVAKMDKYATHPTKGQLRQILLSGTVNENLASSALRALNDLDDNADLQEPIFRLMKALALNKDTPEETQEIAVVKLTHLFLHTEKVRDEAKVALNEVDKFTEGRYAKRIGKAFEMLPEVLRIKKLRDTKYKFFAHPKEDLVDHPKNQNDQQRAETLGLQIASAIRLLKADKDQEFIEQFYDPYYFIDGAESTSENVTDFILRIMDGMGKGQIRQDMEKQISKGLDWSLEGRMAWAKKKPNERPPLGAWVFRDGRWYYSIIQNHGRGIKSDSDDPVGFFADPQAFPNFEVSKLKYEKARLASLRATQLKTLELAKARSGLEIYQQVLSPTIFGNLAASSPDAISAKDVITKYLNAPEDVEQLLANIEQQMIYQQKQDPVWYLDGRIAAFERKQERDLLWDYVLWEFFEGRWRLKMY